MDIVPPTHPPGAPDKPSEPRPTPINIYPTAQRGIGADTNAPQAAPDHQNAQPPKTGSSKVALFGVLATIIVAAIGCVGYTIHTHHQSSEGSDQKQSITSAEPVSKWRTYTVSSIGMQVKYPSDWQIEPGFTQFELDHLILTTSRGIASISLRWGASLNPPDCSNGTQQPTVFAGETIHGCATPYLPGKRDDLSFLANKGAFDVYASMVSCPTPCTVEPAPSTSQIQAAVKSTALEILKNISFDATLFNKTQWTTYSTDTYSIAYPKSWSTKKGAASMQFLDPASKTKWYTLPATSNMFVQVSTQASTQSPLDYVNGITSQAPYTPQNSQRQPVTLNGYKGEAYKPYDPKSANYTMVFTTGKTLVSVTMPTANRNASLIIDAILATFQLK